MAHNLCRTCGYKGQFQNGQYGCSITKLPIDPNKDFCSKHHREPPMTCSNCGNPIFSNSDVFIILKDDTISDNLILCPNCFARFK